MHHYSKVPRHLPYPSPNFYRSQKVRFWALSLNNARVWAAVVWKPSKISPKFLNFVCSDYPTMSPPNLVQIATRVLKSRMLMLEHPLKRTKSVSLIINNSAADWSISLKFGTYVERVIPYLPHMFRSKGQRSRSQCDVMEPKIYQIVNNSAERCSISIKLTTDYDHVTTDLPQTFKVNGSKVKVIA